MKWIVLSAAVVAAAVFVRTWKLAEYPTSLTMDEVSVGYGAYALLMTGKDDRGATMPLAFFSQGDYKPPVNFYLDVLPIKIWGLTEWSARFPVALLGALSAAIFMVIVRKLGMSRTATIMAGLWWAVVPWQVHFSRFGIEAVTGVFFLLIGVAGFINGVKYKSSGWFTVAMFGWGMSVWAYHSNRLFVPLLVLLLVWQEGRRGWQWMTIKKAKWPLTILALLAVPFIYLTVSSPAIRQRAAMTSILREPSLATILHKGVYLGWKDLILNNDAYLVFHHWAGKYLGYFDLRFWFWKGLGLTAPGYPDTGLLYLVDLPLFLSGIWGLVKSHNRRLKRWVAGWFFLGPLAASLAMNEQHTLRTLVWLPVFGLLIAQGWEWWWDKIKKDKKKWAIAGYLAILSVNIFYVADLYSLHMPKFFSEFWGYGFKQAAVYICEHKQEYDQVIFSPVFGSWGPEMVGIPDYYVLFYCKYPPRDYIAEKKIRKLKIERIDWTHEKDISQRLLLISGRWDYPEVTVPENYVIKRIDYQNGMPGLYIVDNQKGTRK
jgi:4-amino-4-deoxy-L-arabinose transferase-like glycosyltransferase